jgi:hypothetical protein
VREKVYPQIPEELCVLDRPDWTLQSTSENHKDAAFPIRLNLARYVSRHKE